MRKKGASLKDISEIISASKSTIRLWTKDIILSAEARQRLYTKQLIAMTSGANNQRERRRREIEKIIESAKAEINEPISASAFKLLGAMVYWAEGAKYGQFTVANSDPLLIRFMVEWMKKVFAVKCTDMKAHLNIYPQQNDAEIKKFWSAMTGIPLANFGKTVIKPPNKYYKKNTLYYGTIKIRLFRSVDKVHRTFGWVREMLNSMSIDVDQVTTRWNSLKTDYGRVPITLPKNPEKV